MKRVAMTVHLTPLETGGYDWEMKLALGLEIVMVNGHSKTGKEALAAAHEYATSALGDM